MIHDVVCGVKAPNAHRLGWGVSGSAGDSWVLRVLGPGGVTVTAAADVRRVGALSAVDAVSATRSVVGPGVNEARDVKLGAMAKGDTIPISATSALSEIGLHTVTIDVDPGGTVVEVDEGNNSASVRVLVPSTRVFLPLTVRD